MEKEEFPTYDSYEKPESKVPVLKKKDTKCYHSAKYYCQLILSNLGICTLLIGYTLMGSFVFLWVEKRSDVHAVELNGPTNASQDLKPDELSRTRAVENIWEITVSLNILYRDNWTRLAGQELVRFQEEIVSKLSQELARTRSEDATLIQWNYPRAFLYSLTVLTTIGFGGYSPRTAVGKLATILYAVVGIPLMLLYLSSVGSVLSKCARGVCSRTLCCCLCSNCGYCCYDETRMQQKEKRMKRKRQMDELVRKQLQEPYYVRSEASGSRSANDKNEDDWTSDPGGAVIEVEDPPASIIAPLTLCLLIMLLYILIGSIILIKLEPWPFLDCCYFCFMSLSTINLTDIIIFHRDVRNVTLWICSVYILTGLALTAMCFNILHDELLKRLKKQIMKGLRVKKETRAASTLVAEPTPDLYTYS